MKIIRITANEEGKRLDSFLRGYLVKAGTGFIYRMLRKKNIILNGKKASGKERLATGDEIRLYFADDTFEDLVNRDNQRYENLCLDVYKRLSGIAVVWEDERILIVDKPAGILTQKANAADYSLNEWLLGYLLHKGELEIDTLFAFRPAALSRLDRNTSGLVICGKTLKGSREASLLIKEQRIEKLYLCIVTGRLEAGGELKAFQRKDARTNKVSISEKPTGGKDEAFTHTVYRPLYVGERETLVEARLITGKSHQIRAHFAYLRHPLVGDHKYGKMAANAFYRQAYDIDSQLLCAYKLIFPALDGDLKAWSRLVVNASVPEVFGRVFPDIKIKDILNIQE